MTLELVIYLNLVLLPRLAFTRSDEPVSLVAAARMFAVFAALLLLVFQPVAASAVALAMAAIALFWEPLLGARVELARGYRLLGLALQALVPLYIGSFGEGFAFSALANGAAGHLAGHLPFLVPATPYSLHQAASLLMGLLLLGNETNILVRAVFHHLGLEPRRPSSPDIDTAEYNAGRVIGILERWLMLLVVLWSEDLSALAFIIAAKGLARFRQLEEKQFAEYMLVGTLLSALAAILVGMFIKRI